MNDVITDVNKLNDTAMSIADEHLVGLNSVMNDIDEALRTTYFENAVEGFILRLSNELFKSVNVVEKIGAYDIIGKIDYKSKFNECYMNPVIDKAKPTVAELTAYAEKESLQEQLRSEAYSKAYKIAKDKVDAAESMLTSLRLLYSNKASFSTKKTLNE